MSEQANTPVEAVDPFQGGEPTFEEFSKWRESGEVPERFKAKTDDTKETPAAQAETVDGKEPPKEAEQEKKDAERDEKGQFKAKVEFSPEQQEVLNREIKKAKEKARREFDKLAATTSVPKATAADKKPEIAQVDPSKPPELPKLAEYKGTIEEFDKEVAEYPAKLHAFLDHQRQISERDASLQKRWSTSEAKAFKTHPDYKGKFDALTADVKTNDEPEMPLYVLNAIGEEADDPHELTYHLATNRDEYRRLASLTPNQAVREVIKLDVKLGLQASIPAPDKKPAEPKPKPPAPVATRASSSAFDVNDESLDPDEWSRQRNEQLAKRGRR